jgi:hypothetical protein
MGNEFSTVYLVVVLEYSGTDQVAFPNDDYIRVPSKKYSDSLNLSQLIGPPTIEKLHEIPIQIQRFLGQAMSLTIG